MVLPIWELELYKKILLKDFIKKLEIILSMQELLFQ